jgi:hypothetical protein
MASKSRGAFEIGVFESGRYIPEAPAYKAMGALGVQLGLEWEGTGSRSEVDPGRAALPTATGVGARD